MGWPTTNLQHTVQNKNHNYVEIKSLRTHIANWLLLIENWKRCSVGYLCLLTQKRPVIRYCTPICLDGNTTKTIKIELDCTVISHSVKAHKLICLKCLFGNTRVVVVVVVVVVPNPIASCSVHRGTVQPECKRDANPGTTFSQTGRSNSCGFFQTSQSRTCSSSFLRYCQNSFLVI